LLEAYQEKLFPLAEEWGRIEVQGMRPAIADLSSGEGVPPEAIVTEAEAWTSGLEGIRTKMKALDVPPRLVRASRLFDQSMLRYIEAAGAFRTAAATTGDRRAAIDRGIEIATDGARIYNEASIVLQAERRRVGLAPTPDFPDKPAEG
jgi:hypothetical protein